MSTTNTSRRKFMAALGASGAAVVAAALTDEPAREKQVAGTPDARKAEGYRLTEHIQEYYRTARV